MKYSKEDWENYNKATNFINQRITNIANIFRSLELKYQNLDDYYRDSQDQFTQHCEWEEETAKGEDETSIWVREGDDGGDYARDSFRSVTFHTNFLWDEQAMYDYIEALEIRKRANALAKVEEIRDKNEVAKLARLNLYKELKKEFGDDTSINP